jgi:predicted amidophosphoribosyltransferase
MVSAERPCPFCGTPSPGQRCPGCQRDVTGARRPCKRCGKMTPSAESTCCHCHAAMGSELSWKIPVIILLFVAAFVVSILIHMAR